MMARSRMPQPGFLAGLHEQDMESIFSDLSARIGGAIAEAAAVAANAGMPESTAGPILAGVSKRAGMIGARFSEGLGPATD